jgi:transcriptional regulator with XRE-family HTH domain
MQEGRSPVELSSVLELSPLQRRRRLGQELRRLRSAAGLSGEQLGELVGVSQAKISRIETGATARPALDIVTKWLDAVRASEADRSVVVELASSVLTEVSSWHAMHRGTLENRQRQLMDLDAEAREIRHFQPFLVPGPMQTAEYARAVIAGLNFSAETDVEAAVATRLERGRRLRRPRGPAYHVVLTEMAVRWVPSGTDASARKAQWRQLIEFAKAPRITLQVIPIDAPMETSPLVGFVWVTFRDADQSPVVRVETPVAGLAFAGSDDIETFGIVWDRMVAAALSPNESTKWLNLLIRQQR